MAPPRAARKNNQDVDQSEHPDPHRRRDRLHRAPVRSEGQRRPHHGHPEDHRESNGRRIPRGLSHRRQRESRHQHRPADLGVQTHSRPAGHPAHHLRAPHRRFSDRRRIQRSGRVRRTSSISALPESLGAACRELQPRTNAFEVIVGLQRGHTELLLGLPDTRTSTTRPSMSGCITSGIATSTGRPAAG